jgi:hypothetical protein
MAVYQKWLDFFTLFTQDAAAHDPTPHVDTTIDSSAEMAL